MSIQLLHCNPDEALLFLRRYRVSFPAESWKSDDQIWRDIDSRINQILQHAGPVSLKEQGTAYRATLH